MKALAEQISDIDGINIYGRVVGVRGLMVEIAGPIHAMSVGARIVIDTGGNRFIPCEVIGFTGNNAVVMPFAGLDGVRRGCRAVIGNSGNQVRPSAAWLGRVLNALGEPIDGKGPLEQGASPVPYRNAPPPAHSRKRVGSPLDLGVRALNTFLTCCRGQRLGIFAGSGVGKSVLLSMLARNVDADITVIGLVGERGREVQEFLQDDLGARRSRALGGGGCDLRRACLDAAAGSLPHARDRRAFSRRGQGCAVPDGFGHALCDVAARDRAVGRRAADRQGLYADRLHRAAETLGTCRPRHRLRHHHRHFYGAGRWRRS